MSGPFVCPHCDESIGQADLENDLCPHCGRSFDAEVEEEPEE